MSYQNLTIVGNVGRDAELKYTQQGIALLKFNLPLGRHQRRRIETLNSQLVALGLQRLHARTVDGFLIKVHATLFAITATFVN